MTKLDRFKNRQLIVGLVVLLAVAYIVPPPFLLTSITDAALLLLIVIFQLSGFLFVPFGYPLTLFLLKKRPVLYAVLCWLGGLAAFAAWNVAASNDFDKADKYGGQGSMFAGVEWLIVAFILNVIAVWLQVRSSHLGTIPKKIVKR